MVPDEIQSLELIDVIDIQLPFRDGKQSLLIPPLNWLQPLKRLSLQFYGVLS